MDWQPKVFHRGGRLTSIPSIILMVVKELRYLLLDKGVCTRNYGNSTLFKPKGIWWLGRNRFISYLSLLHFTV
jgi:hypothetical protein